MSNLDWTVAQALAWAVPHVRHVSPRSGAEVLLAHVLGVSRERVLAHPELPLAPGAREQYRALVERCAAGEPLYYLLGRREFYGLEFAVDARVLIPRPETEHLVDAALAWARARPHAPAPKGPGGVGSRAGERVPGRAPGTAQDQAQDGRGAGAGLTLVDVGTGSGAIAVALAQQLPGARVIATDVSPAALAVARANARRHHVAARVTFLVGDLLAPVHGPLEAIVANLPYVARDEQGALAAESNVVAHEPHVALDGGRDGLALVRRLLEQAPARLRPGGALFLEIGAGQAAAACALAHVAFAGARVETVRDLAGHERVITVLSGSSAK